MWIGSEGIRLLIDVLKFQAGFSLHGSFGTQCIIHYSRVPKQKAG